MVGFKVEYNWYEIGAASFLHSFFSTVAYHLENNNWGSKYPKIMNELYQGTLKDIDIPEAIGELKQIKSGLKAYSPNQVIWDFDDLSKQPPWGNNISRQITDLSNYFVTSDGRDFIELFFRALETAKEIKSDVIIHSL